MAPHSLSTPRRRKQSPIQWADLDIAALQDHRDQRTHQQQMTTPLLIPQIFAEAFNRPRMATFDLEFDYGQAACGELPPNPYHFAHSDVEAKAKCKYWPDLPYTVTTVPYKTSVEWKKQQPTQATFESQGPIFQALRTTDIAEDVLRLLPYKASANFALTCRAGLEVMDRVWTWWDAGEGNFNDCELSSAEMDAKVAAGTRHEDDKQRRRGARYLIIAPSRKQLNGSLRGPPIYRASANNLVRMFRALHHFGNTVRCLKLIRIDLLTAAMVSSTILHQLPNLDTLDLLACPLLQFHHTPQLLRAVGAYQDKHFRHIHFDFAPRFHQGSPWDSQERTECFGLAWEDLGLDFGLPVVDLLYHDVLPLLDRHKQMHCIEHGSVFHEFLLKVPLPSQLLPQTLAVFKKFKSNVDDGVVLHLSKQRQIDCGLALATCGSNGQSYHMEDISKWSANRTCLFCGNGKMSLFFPHAGCDRCASCLLSDLLRGETDHLKPQRNYLTSLLGFQSVHDDKKVAPNPTEILELDQHDYLQAENGLADLSKAAGQFIEAACVVDLLLGTDPNGGLAAAKKLGGKHAAGARGSISRHQAGLHADIPWRYPWDHEQKRHFFDVEKPRTTREALDYKLYRKSNSWEQIREDEARSRSESAKS